MKFTTLILSVAASTTSPALANPIGPNEVAAIPTSSSSSNFLTTKQEATCLPAWADCKAHLDCCSCYCAYSVLWGFVCGGNAWTGCKDVDPPAVATAAVKIGDSALEAPKVTTAPIAPHNMTGVTIPDIHRGGPTVGGQVAPTGL